jgi:hypothetical protein
MECYCRDSANALGWTCPAGLLAVTGLRWWRRKALHKPEKVQMAKTASKRSASFRFKKSRRRQRKTAPRQASPKAVQRKPKIQSPTRSIGKQRADSKQAGVIALLRTPAGATIAAMAGATGWQSHSVRGFLAAVVRKKLGLNLISEAGNAGRVYRIKKENGPVGAPNTSRST